MKYVAAWIIVGLTSGVLFAQSVAERRILETEKHLVTVWKTDDRVVFMMEAIDDFTENRDNSKPLGVGWDYAGIRVDINNNRVIDENVDIAFGKRQKSRVFCPQYLISEGASTGCGVYRSKGSSQAAFKETASQSKPHPVHVYQIPISELMRGGGKIGLTFVFHDASTGTFHFPNKKRPRSFDKTILLDLSEL